MSDRNGAPNGHAPDAAAARGRGARRGVPSPGRPRCARRRRHRPPRRRRRRRAAACGARRRPACAARHVGAMLGLGFAIFSTTAILASKIAHDYDLSFRFLVQVAVLPGFTIVAGVAAARESRRPPHDEPPARAALVARGLGARARCSGARRSTGGSCSACSRSPASASSRPFRCRARCSPTPSRSAPARTCSRRTSRSVPPASCSRRSSSPRAPSSSTASAEWRAPFFVLAAGVGGARVRGRSAARRPAGSCRGRGDVR